MHAGNRANRRRPLVGALSLALALAAVACEPASITDARNELRDGSVDTIAFQIPLLRDTVQLVDAVSETDTASTASGAFGIRVDQQSLDIGIADALSFGDVSFEAFSLGYDGLLQTTEISQAFTVSAASLPPLAPPIGGAGAPAAAPPFSADTVRFSTGNGATVLSAQIGSGIVVRTIDNQTNCDISTGVALRDSGGAVVASFSDLPVAAGAALTDSIDLAGVTIQDFVEPDPTASFSSCSGLPTGSLTVGFVFRPMSMASVTLAGIDETFTGGYSPFDDRFDALDTVGIAGGGLRLDLSSRVPFDLSVDLTVAGLLEGGAPLQRSIVVPAAPVPGTIIQGIDLDLAGTVLIPADAFVSVTARAVADTAVVTAATVAQAADVAATGGLDVDFLVGVLDPADLPELAQSLEVEERIDPGSVDFEDVEDVARGVSIQDAQLSFLVANGLGVSFSLDTFQVGVARTDAFGLALRNGDGSVAFETDSLGQPILIGLAPPGSDALPVPAAGTVDEVRQAAPLVDRIVDILLDDEPVALVAAGTVVVGDGTVARVSASDSVSMAVDLVVGFDVVIPDSGLVFDVAEAVEGAGLDSADIAEVTSRLLDARLIGEIETGFPIEMTLEIAVSPRVLVEADDVFADPDRVSIGTIVVPAAPVDPASGLAITAAIDTVEATLTGADAAVMLADSATVAVRVRVRGDAAAGGRARLRSTDRLLVRLSSVVRALLGGAR